jgi:hypothetical protein
MRIIHPRRLWFAPAIGLLAAVTTVSLAIAGPAAAGPLSRIDAAAAQPYVASPTYGALPVPDYEALWSVALADGQQIIVKLYMPDSEDFDLYLWGPNTTDFTWHSSALVDGDYYLDNYEVLKYVVPTGQGGTYYVDIRSFSTPADPSYWFTVNIQSPGARAVVTAPAVRKVVRLSREYRAYGTLKPLHLAGESTVKVQWQKYVNRRWRTDSTERPDNIDYRAFTRYQVEYEFWGWGSGSMRWRVRAIHPADAMHPRAVSAWRYFVVRN